MIDTNGVLRPLRYSAHPWAIDRLRYVTMTIVGLVPALCMELLYVSV